MKKHFGWIVALFVAISLVFCFVGCKEPEPEQQAPITGDNNGNGGNQSGGGNDSGNGGNQSGGENNSGNENLQNYKYSKDLWGKWKRIDNGQVYTISGDSIKRDWETFDNVVLTKESENILVLGSGATAYRLFRTGGGTRTFTAKVAGFQNVVSRGTSDSETQGIEGLKVNRKSKDIATDTDSTISGEDGTITFEDVVADEVQVITVETENGNTVEVELKPSYDGEHVGTIPIVESGYSFKTTYSIGDSEWYNDNQQLYCFGNNFKEYYLTFRFTNIGDETCSTAKYELLANTNDTQLKLSNTAGAISSITPGGYKDVTVKVSYGDLDEYYKDVTIAIKITDSKLRKTWLDSITLRFYQTPISLNMYAYNANKTGQLNGFVICPDGRSEYFDAWHDWAINKLVPYNKNGSNDYTVVFSATDANNEMAYTLNARHCQNYNQDKFDFEPVFASSELFDFVDSYEDGEGNNTEDTAVEFEDSMETIKSYVQYGDIDYFKLSLDDVLYSRIEEIKIPKAGIGATAKAVQATIKGKNFKSPLENVTLDCSSNFIVGNLNKRIIDDETMYVDLQIPSNDGDYEVTAKSEFNDAKSTFEVKEYEVETGDYVLKDNRIVRQEYITELTDKEKEKIFGVISIKDTGEPVIVGLNQGESLVWTPDSNEKGFWDPFTEISVTIEGGQYDDKTGIRSDYIFIGDQEGYDNWEYICKIDTEGTKNAKINYPVFNFANTYGAFAGLEGTDFENGWYVPSVKELYDVASLNKKDEYACYWSSSASNEYNAYAWSVTFHDNSKNIEHYQEKRYTHDVLVFHKFDPELFTDYEYPEAIIESVEIPVAGEGYTGELPVKIKGENLKGNEITCDDVTFSNVTYINNTSATATIICTGFVGESTITVTSGSSSATVTVKVVEAEKCFTVGDILFTDGTIIKANKVKNGVPDELLSKAFSVIGSVSYNGGTGLGVGLKIGEYLQWAPENTTGFNTLFTAIVANVTVYEYDNATGKYTGHIFTGNADGSDNWEEICKIDPEGTKDAATNYPAFNFANTYGTTAGLTGTDFETGWYVPSVKELFDIYENKDFIQSSLDVVNGITLGESYLSSSQSASYYSLAYQVSFGDGYVDNYYKKYDNNVIVLQAFNPELFNNYEYPEAIIESVEIPVAGEGYTGELPVKIKGENLKGNEITCDDVTFSNVTYINNTSATATIICDGNVGENRITVISGNSRAYGTVNVIPKEYCFNVGDVVFTDGTRVKAENAKYGIPDGKSFKAFGVVASTSYGGGVGKIVGLKLSDYLKWSPVSSVGYSTEFIDIKEFDIDGSDNWEYVCSIDPAGTQDASVDYPIFDFANTYGETAKLTGTDYAEGWYVPTIAELYDICKNKDIVQASLTKLMSFSLDNRFWSSSQDSYVSQSLGFDFYQGYSFPHNKDNTEKVLVIQQFECDEFTLYEYPQPKLTSVEVQIAGEGYKGKLPVTIIGENIKGYEITCSDSTFANLTYLSDSKATATIYCDGTVGTDLLTVTCGSSSPITGTVKVISSSKCFTNSDIGKIIIEDGSLVSKDKFDSSTMTAVAVAAALKYNGAELLGLGLQRGENLQWAPDKTVGYETDFVGIEISQEQTDYDGNTGVYSYKFTGDLDGKDNWEYICGVDPEGEKDAATNYPAFNFANTYGSTYLTGSNYEEGWFIPSANELYDIFINKDVLHESFILLGQEYLQWAGDYWTSSQEPSLTFGGMYVNISNRYTCGTSKYDNRSVLVVYSFSAE